MKSKINKLKKTMATAVCKKTKLLLALCLAVSMVHAQIINKVAGNGTVGYSGNGGQATNAALDGPGKVAFDASGNLYICDMYNNVIRKVNSSGVISTVAGNGFGYASQTSGSGGFTGDGGQATAAELNTPSGIAFDASGNMYIADQYNNRVRKVNTSGIITTFAGNGTSGHTGDGGQATAAELSAPIGLAFDASGNLYVVNYSGGRVRKINSSGIISTVAGGGSCGTSSCGDGGQATAASLWDPAGIVIDGSGNLYITELQAGKIRKVNTSGIISTVAGNGTPVYSGDGGQATSAGLGYAIDVTLDSFGNLFITDNARVRKIIPSGTITTVVGNGTGGYSGDGGQATAAELSTPYGLAFDASGNLYVADEYSNHSSVRKVIAPYCDANAGPNVNDVETCTSFSVQIGTPSVSGLTYTWSPATRLNSTTAPQPICSYALSNTTTAVFTVTVTGTGCTTSTSSVQVTPVPLPCPGCCRVAAGITTENQSEAVFTIYPNPANNEFTIKLSDKAEYIRIIDMQGRLVFETKDINAGEFKLDISKYNKGIYFVSSKMGNAVEKQKLIVE